jgi:hypothetical protein
MTIADFFTEGKYFRYVTALVIVLVGCVSFGLGRLSVSRGAASIVVHQPPGVPADFIANTVPPQKVAQPQNKAPEVEQGIVTASKNGSVYYPFGCSGASRIKPENRVSFVSEQAAVAAGYRLARTCGHNE